MISVVIAVLNTEKYIGDCLESVIRQSYSDLEIIIVDGGSTDSTIEIIEEYGKKDRRIRFFSCDKKSYGAQMNLGISYARGDYIAILEADDKLPHNAYEILMRHMERTDADIVKGDFDIFITTSDGHEIHDRNEQFGTEPQLYGSLLDCRNRTDILEKDLYLWKGIYKTSFLKDNTIEFSETQGAALQDQGFIIKTLIKAKSVYYSNDCVYFYRKDNENSSVYSPKCMTFLADEYEGIIAYINTLEECELYLPHIYRRLLLQVRTRYLLRAVFKQNFIFPETDVKRVQKLLKDALEYGYLGKCMRYQKDLYELDLFTTNEFKYGENLKETIEAERRDIDFFVDKISRYATLVLWGCGKNEGMLRMIMYMKGINSRIIRADIDKQKVSENEDIFYAREIAEKDDGECLYIACSSEAKFQIRRELHDIYKIPYSRIAFYELGTAHYLFWM